MSKIHIGTLQSHVKEKIMAAILQTGTPHKNNVHINKKEDKQHETSADLFKKNFQSNDVLILSAPA